MRLIAACLVGVLAALSLLFTLLVLCFALLGFLGILADVGPAENTSFGVKLSLFAIVPAAATLILIFAGVLLLLWHRKHHTGQ